MALYRRAGGHAHSCENAKTASASASAVVGGGSRGSAGVVGKPHLGTMVNLDSPPRVGDKVRLGDELCEVIEVVDLLPPHSGFAYLHVTCRPVEEEG